MLSDKQIFKNRHALEEADILERAGHFCTPIDVMAWHTFEQIIMPVFMPEREASFGWLVKARDAIEHGRLARTIRSDERRDFTLPNFEGEIIHGGQPAKSHREVIDREKWF